MSPSAPMHIAMTRVRVVGMLTTAQKNLSTPKSGCMHTTDTSAYEIYKASTVAACKHRLALATTLLKGSTLESRAAHRLLQPMGRMLPPPTAGFQIHLCALGSNPCAWGSP
eukprot:994052-Prorocentrum_minimum.AAC.1